jgi:hypothetical protein
MKRKMNNKVFAVLGLMMLPLLGQAQFQEGASQIQQIVSQIKQLAPAIILVGFLVGALMNIGKIWGADKDYMGFFKGCFLYAIGVTVIVGLVTWIGGISF